MNIQRNIFAGLLIFSVFLVIPIYLDFIGVGQNDFTNPTSEDAQEQLIERVDDDQRLDKIEPKTENGSSRGDRGVKERKIIINTDYYRMVLSNQSGGSIVEYHLTEKNDALSYKYIGSYEKAVDSLPLQFNYRDSANVALINNIGNVVVERAKGLEACAPCISINGSQIYDNFSLNTSQESIYIAAGESSELVFSYKFGANQYIEKKIILDGDGYDFESQYSYNLNDDNIKNWGLEIVWNSGILPTETGGADVYEAHSAAYIYQNGSLESIAQSDQSNVQLETFRGQTDWFAIRNKYFGVVIIPENPMEYATLSSVNAVAFEDRETTPIYTVVLGSDLGSGAIRGSSSFTTYLGPLDVDHIAKLDSGVESIMNFGWAIIKPFSRLILWLIKTIHYSLGINYGVVLILIAFLMRFIMGPLTKKSAESSAKMQEMGPLQKKLQAKYKNNPQQLQKEMGALWKKHGVNPISGCLPMLLQWPVLMSFFIVFRSTIEFRGEPFVFWIKDLSQPDYLFSLPFSIPLYGSAVAVLPIIMGVSMFLTMGVTMQDKSQKPMMYFMNFFFILIFNSFPSGLTLYYTIFNFLSYQQQLSIKKNK